MEFSNDFYSKIDPEINAHKGYDYIVRQHNSQGNMLGLASPEPISSTPAPANNNHHLQFTMPLPFSFPPIHAHPGGQWDPTMTIGPWEDFEHFAAEWASFHNGFQSLSLEDDQVRPNSRTSLNRLNHHCSSETSAAAAAAAAVGERTGTRSPELKVCRYYNKGFCKHGNNCRFFHEGLWGNEIDEHMVVPQSLEQLEIEITELLKSKRGGPVSIASLPMLYSEKYGKALQAEGYLTESQRHGKVGYNLTKLLARLKTSIRLIERPNGQHSVILAEDLPKYIDYKGDTGTSGSRQIYITFPAESTFTEQNVSDYFRTYGPVQDVRIPCQQKRMFGFVTFVLPETVKQIFSKPISHYVCGARILVKPYREKSRPVHDRYYYMSRHCTFYDLVKVFTRKHKYKFQQPMYCQPHCMNCGTESLSLRYGGKLCWGRQLMEDYELAIEHEQRRRYKMPMTPKYLAQSSCYFGADRMKLLDEGHCPSTNRSAPLPDVWNIPAVEDNNMSFNDSDSFNLPESPFASPVRNIST